MKNPAQTFQKITTTIDNCKTVISTIEIIVKGTPERKLYDITKQDQVWMVTSYECKGDPRIIKTYETDETIIEFAKKLVSKFENGRILESSFKKGEDNFYRYNYCIGAFTRYLSRKQVQSILRYERDGTIATRQIDAVAQANPTLLPSSKDFGDYSIDAWFKGKTKRGYFYMTFCPTTKKHLDKLVYKY